MLILEASQEAIEQFEQATEAEEHFLYIAPACA